MGSSKSLKPSKSSKTFRSRHDFDGFNAFDDLDAFDVPDEALKSQWIQRFRLNDKAILGLLLGGV